MSRIKERGLRALNLKDYNSENIPEYIGQLKLTPPSERQYVLRILIKRPFEDLQVPKDLKWCQPMIDMALKAQELYGLRQPFLYLTVRHGKVTSTTDDVWHVDGFSQTITHLPEQNYIWCSHTPTEVALKPINFPLDFDSNRHNIHDFFDKVINDQTKIITVDSETVYAMDPYVIHRRPKIESGTVRTFVRLSFTPIEINDLNNTFNPQMPTNYKRDGRVDFRNKLISYHEDRYFLLNNMFNFITKNLENPNITPIEIDYLTSHLNLILEELEELETLLS